MSIQIKPIFDRLLWGIYFLSHAQHLRPVRENWQRSRSAPATFRMIRRRAKQVKRPS
jgi:hypothetical protein